MSGCAVKLCFANKIDAQHSLLVDHVLGVVHVSLDCFPVKPTYTLLSFIEFVSATWQLVILLERYTYIYVFKIMFLS
jgi:hypothetical protein